MSNPTLRFKSANGLNFPDTVSCTLSDISKYSKGTIERKNCLFIGNEQLVSNFGGATLEFRTEAKGTEFNNGDILFGNIRPYLKKVWLSDQSGIASPDVLIFKVTDSIPGYLKCILSSERFFNHVAQGYKGSKMPRGDKHQIMDFRIQCPCLEEQQKIASFFSTLDQKIELNERKLEALEKLKKGIGRRLLIKDPESQLENSHWKIVRISEVADLITGFPFNSSDFSKSGIRLIKGANIKRGTLSFDQKTSSFWPSDAGLTKYALETGDLLVQMDGALIGESFGRVTEDLLPALLVQRVTRIRATEDIIEIIYQIFCIGNFLKFVQSVKTNTAIPHISLQNIKDFEISIPEDVNELHKLANFFRLLDAKINLVKRKKELYTYLKSGFLQQMFI